MMFKKITIYIVMAVLCPFFGKGQDKAITPIGLSIGMTVPEEFWMTKYEGRSGQLSMNQFRGKMILLDFWGSYCIPCIKALPQLDSLNALFSDRVEIIPVGSFARVGEMEAALKKFGLKGLSMSLIIENKVLATLFPRRLLPHSVWIGTDGSVIGITEGEYVNSDMISKVLEDRNFVLPIKKDLLNDQKDAALFSFARESKMPDLMYYSGFTSHATGIAPFGGLKVDSANKVARMSFYNKPLLSFCKLAAAYSIVYDNDEFELLVTDRERFIRSKGYRTVWEKDNTYCYAIAVPIGWSTARRREFIQADIRRWLYGLGFEINVKNSNTDGRQKYVIKERAVL